MPKIHSTVSRAHGIVETLETRSSDVVIVEMTAGTGHTHVMTTGKFAVQRVTSMNQI